MAQRRLDPRPVARRVGGLHEEPVEPLVPRRCPQGTLCRPHRVVGAPRGEGEPSETERALDNGVLDLDSEALEDGPLALVELQERAAAHEPQRLAPRCRVVLDRRAT